MGLATGLKGLSKKLIDQFGNSITLHVKTLGTFNPATMTQTAPETTYTTKGVVEDYVSEFSQAGDLKVTFYLDTALSEIDSITADGAKRGVLSLRTISAQDVTIIYEAVLSGDGRLINGG